MGVRRLWLLLPVSFITLMQTTDPRLWLCLVFDRPYTVCFGLYANKNEISFWF